MRRINKLVLVFVLFFCWSSLVLAQAKKPEAIKGIFITIWSMLNDKKMKSLINLVEKTELNALVIDVKDNNGNLIFDWVKNIDSFIEKLHRKNIYLIGRISVFKDSELALKKPSIALKKRNGKFWEDNVGGKWVDPAAWQAWSYNLQIAKKAIKIGFDEINFDYVRFPSEGNLKEIVYPVWNKKVPKSSIIRKFFRYVSRNLKSLGKPISIDFFAYAILSPSDLGIGQRFIDCVNYFDYLCPMVYPSHYSKNNFGFVNPAQHPYEVVYQTLIRAKKILAENKTLVKIRPWLQSFNLKAKYTPYMIKLEKKAVYDALGVNNGWLLWNPKNVYIKEALEKINVEAKRNG
ncbi:hypothetical protein J7K44_03295 [bacterium]|nr:hypothetical protein [bacterium]